MKILDEHFFFVGKSRMQIICFCSMALNFDMSNFFITPIRVVENFSLLTPWDTILVLWSQSQAKFTRLSTCCEVRSTIKYYLIRNWCYNHSFEETVFQELFKVLMSFHELQKMTVLHAFHCVKS